MSYSTSEPQIWFRNSTEDCLQKLWNGEQSSLKTKFERVKEDSFWDHSGPFVKYTYYIYFSSFYLFIFHVIWGRRFLLFFFLYLITLSFSILHPSYLRSSVAISFHVSFSLSRPFPIVYKFLCVSSMIGSPIYSLISFSKPDMPELDFHFTLICLCKISLVNVFSFVPWSTLVLFWFHGIRIFLWCLSFSLFISLFLVLQPTNEERKPVSSLG